MTKTGVLKNIGLINVDASAITATSNLIGTTTYGTMENVYIHYSASAANMRTITLAGNGIAVDFTATKVFVDGSDISNTIEFRLVPDPDTTKATGFYGVTPANKDIGCYTGSSNSAYYADTVLNNKLVAAAAIVSWDGTSSWHIDKTTGEVTFGRNA